MKGKPHENSL